MTVRQLSSSYSQREWLFNCGMKRNKNIDKRLGKTVVIGIVIFLLVLVLLVILAFSFYSSGYPDIKILAALFFVYVVGIILKYWIESTLLERMKTSPAFGELINVFGFKEVKPNYYEGVINGYYVIMINQVQLKFYPDSRVNDLIMDLFCDCSDLSIKEIDMIEDSDFVVLHDLIRKFSSNWFTRFDAKKISSTLKKQLEIVNTYHLGSIDEAEVEKGVYWEE